MGKNSPKKLKSSRRVISSSSKVFAQEKVTQEEIDQATKTLREAIAQLKEQPVAVDKETLKEQIAQARGRKPEEGYQFTKETENNCKKQFKRLKQS